MTACYFYQTTHMRKVFNGDFSLMAEACGEAPVIAHRHCFNSYGRDVGSVTRHDPDRAIEYCDYVPAGQLRVECIKGAVQDWFWDESGAEEATAFCALLADGAYKDGCYDMIIVRARDVFTTLEEAEAFCSSLNTPPRQQQCYEAVSYTHLTLPTILLV